LQNLLLLLMPLSLLFAVCGRCCWLTSERAEMSDVTAVHSLHIKSGKLRFALPHVMDGQQYCYCVVCRLNWVEQSK
jgi:hypothetical protein